jgi:hypothetical protein
VIDPQNSARLYCVVQDYVSNRLELLRSPDAGETWTEVGSTLSAGPFLNGGLNSLIVDPHNPTTLYAGTSAGLFAISLRPAVATRHQH